MVGPLAFARARNYLPSLPFARGASCERDRWRLQSFVESFRERTYPKRAGLRTRETLDPRHESPSSSAASRESVSAHRGLQARCSRPSFCADARRCLPNEVLERATGVEPATSSLGSWHSTAELRPLCRESKYPPRHCQIESPTTRVRLIFRQCGSIPPD